MRSSQSFKPLPQGRDLYLEFCEQNLTVQVRTGNEFMCLCPFHDNQNSASLQFNVDKGLYNCFSCGASGNVRSMEKHFGVRFKDQEPDLEDILGKLEALDAPVQPMHVLAESMLKRYDFPTDYWGACPPKCGTRTCKEHRGFTEKTIRAFDLGYDPMNNIATIPVRNTDGSLAAFIRRYLDDDAEAKYKMPKKEQYERKTNLFGAWLVAHDPRDEVVICEGPVDAMMVWQAGFPAVAQYGSSISYPQVRLLRRLGFSRAVLFYDNDKAGIRAAEGYTDPKGKDHPGAMQMLRGFDLRRVQYKDWRDEEGRRIKDPGGLPTSTIKRAVRRAQRV